MVAVMVAVVLMVTSVFAVVEALVMMVVPRDMMARLLLWLWATAAVVVHAVEEEAVSWAAKHRAQGPHLAQGDHRERDRTKQHQLAASSRSQAKLQVRPSRKHVPS